MVQWLRFTVLTVIRMASFVFYVFLGLYLLSVALNYLPVVDVTDVPPGTSVNKVGLSLQSLKYLMFSDDIAKIWAPSPPPPPLSL
tara:strand:+ start:6127 stop:6381 length:255 start_codon:yes stop_codon:yes gene_type:complete